MHRPPLFTGRQNIEAFLVYIHLRLSCQRNLNVKIFELENKPRICKQPTSKTTW